MSVSPEPQSPINRFQSSKHQKRFKGFNDFSSAVAGRLLTKGRLPHMPTPALDPSLLAVRAHEGPMTAELVRNPAAHGLGLPQVPSRLAPAATTRSVCGFCATGCSLHVHLDDEGKAINLSADPSYPGGFYTSVLLAGPRR